MYVHAHVHVYLGYTQRGVDAMRCEKNRSTPETKPSCKQEASRSNNPAEKTKHTIFDKVKHPCPAHSLLWWAFLQRFARAPFVFSLVVFLA